jgi:hypothetical protein
VRKREEEEVRKRERKSREKDIERSVDEELRN